MRLHTIAAIIVLAVAGAAHADARLRPAQWAQPVIGTRLHNFYQVSPELYRSEQPDDEAMGQLRAFGIRSILNLREYHSDDDEARGTDLRLYHVRTNAGGIDDAHMRRALKIIATADKPVLVHCWHGSDRTGAVVALYRMVFQRWPRARAIDEFINGGYGYHKHFYPNIERYLETVDIERLRSQVLGAQAKARAPAGR